MDPNVLHDFLNGNVDDATFQVCEQHLQRSAATDLAVSDSRPDSDPLLQALYQPKPSELDSGWAASLENLIGTHAVDAATLLRWLDPSQDPQSLGCIQQYEIQELLAQGGMGLVFRARDTRLDRQVCLKLLGPQYEFHAEAKARFERESKTASSLTHDRIVAIHDVGNQKGLPFLVMPLLEGQTLRDVLKHQQPLPSHQAVHYLRGILTGLQYAHHRGVLHRDLKPDNVWVNHDDSVKLLDFGLAQVIESAEPLTQSGTVLGTPSYMAPEQVTGAALDPRSDLFSLGVVYVEMLTGQCPFRKSNVFATLLSITQDPVDWPTWDREQCVSQSDRSLIEGLLQKDPEQRTCSIQELEQQLQQYHPLATPLASIETPDRQPPRAGLWIALASFFLMAMGAILWQQTDRGTLVVETSDEQVQVQVQDAKVTVHDPVSGKHYEMGLGQKPLPSGVYQLEWKDPASDLTLSSETVVIRRGQKTLVTVSWKPTSPSKTIASDTENASPRTNPTDSVTPTPDQPSDFLYGNSEFSREDLAQMLMVFGNAGLTDYAVVGSRIRVPRNQQEEFYKALAQNNRSQHEQYFKALAKHDASQHTAWTVEVRIEEDRFQKKLNQMPAIDLGDMSPDEQAISLFATVRDTSRLQEQPMTIESAPPVDASDIQWNCDRSLAMGPDGQLLDGTGQLIGCVPRYSSWAPHTPNLLVSWSPLPNGSPDNSLSVRYVFWRLDLAEGRMTPIASTRSAKLAWRHDHRFLCTGPFGVSVLDLKNNNMRHLDASAPGRVSSVSEDGRYAAILDSANHQFRLLDTHTGNVCQVLPPSPNSKKDQILWTKGPEAAEAVMLISTDPSVEGPHLRAQLFPVQGPFQELSRLYILQGVDSPDRLSLSPDGSQVGWTSEDGFLNVLQLASGQRYSIGLPRPTPNSPAPNVVSVQWPQQEVQVKTVDSQSSYSVTHNPLRLHLQHSNPLTTSQMQPKLELTVAGQHVTWKGHAKDQVLDLVTLAPTTIPPATSKLPASLLETLNHHPAFQEVVAYHKESGTTWQVEQDEEVKGGNHVFLVKHFENAEVPLPLLYGPDVKDPFELMHDVKAMRFYTRKSGYLAWDASREGEKLVCLEDFADTGSLVRSIQLNSKGILFARTQELVWLPFYGKGKSTIRGPRQSGAMDGFVGLLDDTILIHKDRRFWALPLPESPEDKTEWNSIRADESIRLMSNAQPDGFTLWKDHNLLAFSLGSSTMVCQVDLAEMQLKLVSEIKTNTRRHPDYPALFDWQNGVGSWKNGQWVQRRISPRLTSISGLVPMPWGWLSAGEHYVEAWSPDGQLLGRATLCSRLQDGKPTGGSWVLSDGSVNFQHADISQYVVMEKFGTDYRSMRLDQKVAREPDFAPPTFSMLPFLKVEPTGDQPEPDATQATTKPEPQPSAVQPLNLPPIPAAELAWQLGLEPGKPLSTQSMVWHPATDNDVVTGSTEVTWGGHDIEANRQGTLVATYSPREEHVRVWNTHGSIQCFLPTQYPVRAVRWSPIQNYLAVLERTSDRERLSIWNVQDHQAQIVRLLPTSAVDLQWSWDGRLLALQSEDHQIQFYHLPDNAPLPSRGIHGKLGPHPWSADGRFFVLASAKESATTIIWDLEKGIVYHESTDTTSPRFLPTGSELAWNKKGVWERWDLSTFQKIDSVETQGNWRASHLSEDFSRLAYQTEAGELYIRDLESRTLRSVQLDFLPEWFSQKAFYLRTAHWTRENRLLLEMVGDVLQIDASDLTLDQPLNAQPIIQNKDAMIVLRKGANSDLPASDNRKVLLNVNAFDPKNVGQYLTTLAMLDLSTLETQLFPEVQGDPRTMQSAISPDGQWLAASAFPIEGAQENIQTSSRAVYVASTTNPSQQLFLNMAGAISNLQWSTDSQSLVITSTTSMTPRNLRSIIRIYRPQATEWVDLELDEFQLATYLRDTPQPLILDNQIIAPLLEARAISENGARLSYPNHVGWFDIATGKLIKTATWEGVYTRRNLLCGNRQLIAATTQRGRNEINLEIISTDGMHRGRIGLPASGTSFVALAPNHPWCVFTSEDKRLRFIKLNPELQDLKVNHILPERKIDASYRYSSLRDQEIFWHPEEPVCGILEDESVRWFHVETGETTETAIHDAVGMSATRDGWWVSRRQQLCHYNLQGELLETVIPARPGESAEDQVTLQQIVHADGSMEVPEKTQHLLRWELNGNTFSTFPLSTVQETKQEETNAGEKKAEETNSSASQPSQ